MFFRCFCISKFQRRIYNNIICIFSLNNSIIWFSSIFGIGTQLTGLINQWWLSLLVFFPGERIDSSITKALGTLTHHFALFVVLILTMLILQYSAAYHLVQVSNHGIYIQRIKSKNNIRLIACLSTTSWVLIEGVVSREKSSNMVASFIDMN